MEKVHFSAEERVDLSDMTQLTELVLSDFRRHVRGLLLGPDAVVAAQWTNYVVRGFKVEPQAVPDATIRVRLNPGGGAPLGFAIGAENLGRIDFGQLMGGDGQDGTLEGNATYSLDFTAQPPGTYTVQMRFVYVDGSSDNRAFWDEGTLSEDVTATNTRTLPTLELRLSGAPSAEWITLASVMWGGATIVAGNITDARTFVLEGAAPFQKAAQTTATGVPDFSRSTDRAANGLNEIYPALRALMRQVQDLKGPSDTLQYDWFSRPYRPYDPAGALTAGTTKSLRTVDTVTYTVGDGVATVGDFNGATGLDQCLALLAGMAAANRPTNVDIIVHGDPGGNGFVISGQKAIGSGVAKSLVIRIRAGIAHGQLNSGSNGRPKITIDGAALGVGESAIALGPDVAGGLVLDSLDIGWIGTTAGGRNGFVVNGFIRAQHCQILQTSADPDVAAGYMLSSNTANKVRIVGCDIRGRTQFYESGTGSAIPIVREFGLIESTRMKSAQIVLHADTAGTAVTPDMVNGFTIRDCDLEARGTTIYTSATSHGLIDAASASKLCLENVTGAVHGDEGGLIGYVYNTNYAPRGWRVKGCTWSTATTGAHAPGAGIFGGANGVGWGIQIIGSSAHPAFDIQITEQTYSMTSVDAGCCQLVVPVGFKVDGMTIEGCGDNGVAARFCYGLWVKGDSGTLQRGKISGVNCGNWNDSGINDLRCILLQAVRDCTVNDCTLSGYKTDATETSLAAFAAGMYALRENNCEEINVSNCTFHGWARGTNNARCVRYGTECTFTGCIFKRNGGFCAMPDGGEAIVVFNACIVVNSDVLGQGFDLTTVPQASVTNCNFTFGAVVDAVKMDTAGFCVVGNVCNAGNIHRTAAVGGRGWGSAGGAATDITYPNGGGPDAGGAVYSLNTFLGGGGYT
jgi:hypothetical protein